uniref:Ig-like domain-containing protein n=1 Tax=Oreochromis aureus TaxID=47969 RepID=A0A668TH38_OREAU
MSSDVKLGWTLDHKDQNFMSILKHTEFQPTVSCPLTLTPSETVVTFGDPVSVSCSTSATDVEGMGWEAPFGGTGFEPPPVVTWRVEKLEEWTPSPFCYATLVDGSQCTVSPVITVYKIPDTVSIYPMNQSQMMEKHVHYNKHTRTQYWLQCDSINVAPVQFLTVNWYKNNESIMAMSFNDTTTKTPVNESSILKVNISREENVAEFRCEAELDFGPHGPKLYVVNILSVYTQNYYFLDLSTCNLHKQCQNQCSDATCNCSNKYQPLIGLSLQTLRS